MNKKKCARPPLVAVALACAAPSFAEEGARLAVVTATEIREETFKAETLAAVDLVEGETIASTHPSLSSEVMGRIAGVHANTTSGEGHRTVTPAWAPDRVMAGVGTSEDDVTLYWVGLQWEWERRWFTAGDWFLGGYWEFDASYWDGQDEVPGNTEVGEIGITPVFRLQRHQPFASGMRPYLDFAVGAHLLCENKADNRDLSSAFQFGDYLGLGVQLGAAGRVELGYRFQHFSNAGIERPNSGINFHLLHISYRY